MRRHIIAAVIIFGSGALLGLCLRDASPTAIARELPADRKGVVPATGQTKCYDQLGTEIPCQDADCPGQDGFYQAGCPSEMRFVDNMDGTVTDTCTGLMWQKDAADVNGDGHHTDQDVLPWCKALQYCENLSFGGHDDWRLPNVRELQSIIDYGHAKSSINPVFGGSISLYWSSTSVASHPKDAWVVYFGEGWVGFYNGKDVGSKETGYNAWAVRGGA
jgi:hypothetical protein